MVSCACAAVSPPNRAAAAAMARSDTGCVMSFLHWSLLGAARPGAGRSRAFALVRRSVSGSRNLPNRQNDLQLAAVAPTQASDEHLRQLPAHIGGGDLHG